MRSLSIRGERLLLALRWFDFAEPRYYGYEIWPHHGPHREYGFDKGARFEALKRRFDLKAFFDMTSRGSFRQHLLQLLEHPANRALLSQELEIGQLLQRSHQGPTWEEGWTFLKAVADGEVTEADLMAIDPEPAAT